MRAELREGLRYVLRHPYLKNIAACTALVQLLREHGFAVLLVFARASLGFSPRAIGLAFTVEQRRPARRARSARTGSRRASASGRTIIVGSVIGGPAFLAHPVRAARNMPLLRSSIPAFVLGGLANVVYNITQVSLRQAITPERIQGRMNSVMRFIVWGTIPLGSLARRRAGQHDRRQGDADRGRHRLLHPVPAGAVLARARRSATMPEPVDEAAAVLGPLVADAAAVPAQHQAN